MIYLECPDTPGWANGHTGCAGEVGVGNEGCTDAGWSCEAYRTRWCTGNGPKPGSERTLGSKYNYPENNCAVCGKCSGNVHKTTI